MKLVFLLEEQSMKTFLDGILPRILPPDVTFITVPHEGKTDLQKSIPIKLRAWKQPDAIICPKRELKKYLPEHQQISGAKLIAQYIDINNNKSESFQTFVSGVKRLIS